MGPPLRHPSRMETPPRSRSQSASPDPELVRFLNEQKRPCSPESEAFRNKRIAAGGALTIKSRHQREKEEAERKRLDEEHRAAKAYQELIQDMQGTHSGGSLENKSGFVRGGSSSMYEPATRLHPPASSSKLVPFRVMDGLTSSADEEDLIAISTKRDGPGKRKGAMGSFLGELQRDQAQREERLRSRMTEGNSISSLLAQETGGGSSNSNTKNDAVDGASSSNVCILNLPLGVTEAMFGSYFARYGDVASVKIMWPRSADDLVHPSIRSTKSPGATGFVNYMNRGDAERAFRDIDGSEWLGCMLRTSWSKAVRKPMQPLYTRSVHQRDAADEIHKESSRDDGPTRSSRSPGTRNHRRARERNVSPITMLKDAVEKARGEDTVKMIQMVAALVKKFGTSYESMLREKEAGDPLHDFLRPGDSPEHHYYRSLLDEQYTASLPAPPFEDGGEASLYSSDSEEDSEREKLRSVGKAKELGRAAQRRLEAMLRGMTLRRERVARVMVFAIDHAVAAEAVSKVIVESLLQPTTPLPRKLARLYTVSDILHNSSVSASNAWRYRSLFEDKLGVVFLHWGDVANSFPGRIKRESCREMARHILQIWENWLVYEGATLTTWRQNIESGSAPSRVKQQETSDPYVL